MDDIVLTDEENVQLVELNKQAQRDGTEAQKFAIEASKLLSITLDRLADYKDRGFFKRCWYAVSGKNSELERANQADFIKMQRFAWAYLVKLHEQDLLQVRAIAVIRSNLKELQDEVGELSSQISTIVAKFEARLCDVEDAAALQDWLLHLNVRLRDSHFRDARNLFFLQIVFDCLSVMRMRHIRFDKIDMRHDLDAALDNFGFDFKEEVSVEEFIEGLFYEVSRFGFDVFKQLIAIDVGGETVPSEYVLENFSGTGVNALYGFEHEMAQQENLAQQIDEKVRNEIRIKAIKATMTNGRARYSFSELGREIVAACLVLEDLYRSDHEVSVEDMLGGSDSVDDDFDVMDVLNDAITLTQHAFLKEGPTEDEKRSYIESFALVFAAMGGFRDSTYLQAVAKLFGCEDSIDRVRNVTGQLRINPRSCDVLADLAKISTDARKYVWALDAMMLAGEDGPVQPKYRSAIKTVLCRAFKLKDGEVSSFLDAAERVVCAQDLAGLREGASLLGNRTSGWWTVAEYKGIAVEGEIAGKNVCVDSSGQIDVVGELRLEEVKRIPFLAKDIRHAVSFNGKWYVIANGRLWRSGTGREWDQVIMPAEFFETGSYGLSRLNWPKLKVLAGHLVYLSAWDKCYYVSLDGEAFTCCDVSEVLDRFDLRYVQDLFVCGGCMYLQTTRRESYKYSKFLGTGTGYADVTTFLTSRTLHGEWSYDKQCFDLELGREPVCIDAIPTGLVGMTRYENSYQSDLKYKSDYPQLYFCLNGCAWTEASIDGFLYDLKYWWNENCFISSFEEDLIMTIPGRGIYYSRGGRAWKLVESDADVVFLTRFQKMGAYYVAFATKGHYGDGILFLTKDGTSFIRKECSVKLRAAAASGTSFLLADEDSVYVGNIELT